jgi:hypothetical protein
VVVDENHAELGLQLHCLGEHLHKLVHQSFSLRNVGVVNKNDSLGVLLNWTPALFVFEITGNVPEFQVDFTKTGHGWWGVTLTFDNAAAHGGTVELRETFRKFAQNVGDCRFPAPLGTDY